MRHASVELVQAIEGVAPEWLTNDTGYRAEKFYARACGAYGSPLAQVFACIADYHGAYLPHPHAVDCPACLALMRAAICPVRWDSLCERGLVDFLLPKSEAA